MDAKKVLCLFPSGKIVGFDSAKEASTLLELSPSGVRECLTKSRLTCKKFRFEYGSVEEYEHNPQCFFNELKNDSNKSKVPVIVFNSDTTVYCFCNSVSEAAKKIGGTPSAVRDCMKGRGNTVKGYMVVAGTKDDYESGAVKYVLPEKHGKNFPIVNIAYGGIEKKVYMGGVNEIVEENPEYDRHPILRCCNHTQDKAYGEFWLYLDEWEEHKKTYSED